jgi:hypothetical protein
VSYIERRLWVAAALVVIIAGLIVAKIAEFEREHLM